MMEVFPFSRDDGKKGLQEICVDFVKGTVVPGRREARINFGTRLRRMVSYTLRSLCFRGNISGPRCMGGCVCRLAIRVAARSKA
jgi:hypothetical protein